MTKQEIMEVFQLPRAEYEAAIRPRAFEVLKREKRGVSPVAMLGYSNVCKNQCLYCGMRAGNAKLPRYRFQEEQIAGSIHSAFAMGLRRLFLISGEDPKYPFETLLRIIEQAKQMGFVRVSLGAGEFSKTQYEELKAAGLDEYVMKFEMSHKDTFERMNPSTTFEKRNQGIRWIQEAGLDLGSGNIVDYPGQTLEELADDILLMQELSISWAPNIPYMPAIGTPLATQEDGTPSPRGSIDKMQREISLVRLLLPQCDITAQQPGEDIRNGLSDQQGNAEAVRAGGNVLFVDLLPAAQAGNFHVIDHRVIAGLDHVKEIAQMTGLELIC
ncbi:MAG: radical SAM protein [Lachnospiraceae bacterium]|jgi:biotin synthase|nr:radical SAM protein [Lachnospiraceae bacterium]